MGLQKLEQRWLAHQSKPFPSGYRSKRIAGTNLTLLQADLGACIMAACQTGGALGPRLKQTFESSLKILRQVVNELEGEPQAHFREMQALAEELAKNLPRT